MVTKGGCGARGRFVRTDVRMLMGIIRMRGKNGCSREKRKVQEQRAKT